MAIPNNISKEHIERAISTIEYDSIPDQRKEKVYLLNAHRKMLPPKYVLSKANVLANGKELGSNEFNAVEAKDFLISKGFNVIDTRIKKTSSLANFWIEKTIVNGRPDRISGYRALGKALWSPQKDRRGADIYKNMREVRKGDIILHLIDNMEFSGISIVSKEAVDVDGMKGTNWDGPAYLIELSNYTELIPKINRDEILNKENEKVLKEISDESEVFFNSNLNLRQGAYLTPCPIELADLINKIYYKNSKNHLPFSSEEMTKKKPNIFDSKFYDTAFEKDLFISGLNYSKTLVSRFTASLLTKPFVILTGLSGSGKTKLAQAFVQWICADESQYCIVPVGADWTNREPLLGYPNALKPEEYVRPDSGVLDLIIRANKNSEKPYFLILDEMNLSIVERYFADFLSVMESDEEISLYAEGAVANGIPAKLKVPSNLFVIGTVNIDETTNMFSPKVLDRANTIEFRVTKEEMENFLGNMKDINMDALTGQGAGMARSFLDMAANKTFASTDNVEINEALVKFFGELKKTGAEFGYRSATEIMRLIHQLTVLDSNLTTSQKIDIAIMQKLLPKLHGSRRKLSPVLETLAVFCVKEENSIVKDVFEKEDYDYNNPNVIYPLSLEKISRMFRGAVDNGFASFAEA